MKNYKVCPRCRESECDDVICDICGKSCKVMLHDLEDEYNIISGELKFTGHYGSKYDLETLHCDMCESCFDKIQGFIKSIGGQIHTETYSLWKERD